MLERKRLRHQVYDILLNRTCAGHRVFRSRVQPLDESDLPAINIRTPTERGQDAGANTVPTFRSVVSLEIYLQASAVDGVDDLLDDMAEEVEGLILRNPDFVAGCLEFTTYDAETVINRDGDTLIAVQRLRFDLAYHNDFQPTGLGPLESVHLTADTEPVAPDENGNPAGPRACAELPQ